MMGDEYQYTRSPAWEELEPKGSASTSGIHHNVMGAVGGSAPADESSDSDGEQEGPQKLIRKVSTSGQIRSKTSVKEGLLLKQTSSFQRWKKRYFKLRGRTLYYAKDAKTGGVLARWQYRVSRSRVCWRVLSVCWSSARRPPPAMGASGSEEGLVAIRVSRSSSGRRLCPWTPTSLSPSSPGFADRYSLRSFGWHTLASFEMPVLPIVPELGSEPCNG